MCIPWSCSPKVRSIVAWNGTKLVALSWQLGLIRNLARTTDCESNAVDTEDFLEQSYSMHIMQRLLTFVCFVLMTSE